MGWLLPALTEERFETQRDVVLNERRQSYENRPYGLAQFALLDALFPADHPYHWPTIGEPDDLRAATVDDVRAFFARYYHPGNASLAIAGDIDAGDGARSGERALRRDSRGAAGRAGRGRRARRRGRAGSCSRIASSCRGSIWRGRRRRSSPHGDAELDLVADLLANGRTSRLYRRLMHERADRHGAGGRRRRRASSAARFRSSRRPRPATRSRSSRRRSPRSCRSVCDRRADRATSSSAAARRPRRRSSTACSRSAVSAARPISSTPTTSIAARPTRSTRICGAIWSATPAALRAAVQTWLDPAQAVALSVVPRGRAELALARVRTGAPDVTADRFDPAGRRCAGDRCDFRRSRVHVLDNGLRVWSTRRTRPCRSSPRSSSFAAARRHDPAERPGLAGLTGRSARRRRRPRRRDRSSPTPSRGSARSSTSKSGPTSSTFGFTTLDAILSRRRWRSSATSCSARTWRRPTSRACASCG